jgi:DNA-binding NtrC family response regulator
VGGNREKAARLLGMSVRTIRNRLREYRLADVDLGALLGTTLVTAEGGA